MSPKLKEGSLSYCRREKKGYLSYQRLSNLFIINILNLMEIEFVLFVVKGFDLKN